MLLKKLGVTISSLLLLASASANSAMQSNTSSDNTWKFQIAPYIWALNMSGRVQVGPVAGHISETFSDILKEIQWGAMLYVDAQKNNFGLYANVLYALLEKDDTKGPVTVKMKNNFGLLSAGISYIVYQKSFTNGPDPSHILIAPYIGARYTLNDTNVKIPLFAFSRSVNKQWTDPTLGAKVRYDFNKQWQMIIAGDIGGTNFNTDKSYNVQGFVGYRPKSWKDTTLYAGYRLLYQDYITGSGLNRYEWNMKIFGPVLGAAFGF